MHAYAAAPPDPVDWTFRTARIAARLLDARDLDLYRALYADPAVMAHIGAPLPEDDVAGPFAAAVACNADPAARARYWRLDHARTGAPLGLFALVRRAREPACGEIGMMLLPAGQRSGAGLQALAAAVGGALSGRWPLGMDALEGRHARANAGAGRLVAALGFQRLPDAGGTVAWRIDRARWDARPAAARRLRTDRTTP